MFFLVIAFTAVFSIISFGFLLPKVDSFFASRDIVTSYEKDAAGVKPGLFIAGKMFVRGVSYYSGNKNMAVLTDDPKGAFYTRHSIPMISSTEDLLRTDVGSFPAYCFLRKKDYDFLKTIVDSHFKVTVLEGRPEKTLVRLDRV